MPDTLVKKFDRLSFGTTAEKRAKKRKAKAPETRAATGVQVRTETSIYNPIILSEQQQPPTDTYQASGLAEALEQDQVENAFTVIEAERRALPIRTRRVLGLTSTIAPKSSTTRNRNAADVFAAEMSTNSTTEKWYSVQLQVSIHDLSTGAELTRQCMLPAERCPSPSQFRKALGELHQAHMDLDGINDMPWMKAELFLFSTGIDSSVAFARLKKGQQSHLTAQVWNKFMSALEKKGIAETAANKGRAERAQRRMKGRLDAEEVEQKFAGITGAVKLFFGRS